VQKIEINTLFINSHFCYSLCSRIYKMSMIRANTDYHLENNCVSGRSYRNMVVHDDAT